jgi:SAM-dependent methyltransferase
MARDLSGEALWRWRHQLEGWAIPDEILRAAPESPWGFPAELFRRRAEADSVDTPSRRLALEALPVGGSALDVGAGAGAASLALLPRVGRIVAVDESVEMLSEFRSLASARGVRAETVHGRWPDVAHRVEPQDVVVCHHVLYNVPDLNRFATALTAHARHRVVVEITGRHPLTATADLWQLFHGLDRPGGPNATDVEAVLRQGGVEAHREEFRPAGPSGGFERRAEAVAFVRRRLCLPADRDPEVEAALGDRLVERDGLWDLFHADRLLVTLWWDGEG